MSRTRLSGLVLGPLLAIVMLLMSPPEGLSPQGWHIALIVVWMAVWWMSEAVPLAVTALIPLASFPLLDVATISGTAAGYAHPLIFLFLGGFLLARAMHVWSLDRRIAYGVIRRVGTDPRLTIGACMAVTAFLSMWVSNTASAMVMLPIGHSIVSASADKMDGTRNDFAPALMLGIAYAATIGGMATLIGTPPNALFAGYMSAVYGIEIGFARWMAVGLPLVLVMLPLTWLVLTRLSFHIPGKNDASVDRRWSGFVAPAGPMTTGERRVAILILVTAAAWVTRPLIDGLFPAVTISDAGIAIIAAILAFAIPVDLRRGRFLLSWSEAAEIRWDVLILFGGGLALASAIGASDLDSWLGNGIIIFENLPVLVLLLVIGVFVVFAGELASNTAMAAVLLPIAGAAAVTMNASPQLLALSVALFATLGFMLPVATPPNAIVFSTGAVGMRHMIRAGLVMNIIGILVVTAVILTFGRFVLPSS
jgi:sodium-dependent dicarboxylate transporter 2/3/5